MSKPYPSRRELRLQRERDERAKLRDQNPLRWTDEVEQRQQRGAEAEQQANETLAQAEPVPASDATPAAEELAAPVADDVAVSGRRAASSPVDAPSGSDVVESEPIASRRRRRADSEVRSTGMLPIITKRRDDNAPKPRSRREAREQAAQKTAERRADIEALEAQQAGQTEAEPKVVRRATAPQAPPPPIPADSEPPTVSEAPVESAVEDEDHEEDIVVSTSAQYSESATEITDMSGLDTMEIRRAELRAETEKLTQEIIALGQENPNVIDPLLLRRQKELAEKSQELQELETAAIATVDEQGQQETSDATDDEPAKLDQQAPLESKPFEPAVEEIPAETHGASDESEVEEQGKHTRRARRANSGPVITGPFEVSDANETSGTNAPESKPDFASHFKTPLETDALEQTGPDQPLDASWAHGLDTLDPKESEAPERRLMAISFIVFAIGIIALIAAIIMFTR